jgi:hypothetical protein
MKHGDGSWPPLVWRFLAATALGCGAWLAYPETPNPVEHMLAALIAGFGGQWLLWTAGNRVAGALLREKRRG